MKNTKTKKSFFAEFSLLSISATLGLVALVTICFLFYGLMSTSPKKIVKITDDAGIFTEEEMEQLEDKSKSLSKKKDINVIIVTTRDKGKGYTNSDEDCAKFAGDTYKKQAIKTSLVNNSGICMLVDLTEDEPGRRFFWLYTYGTAYFAITDDECTDIFRSHKSELQNQEYFQVYMEILDELEDYNYNSMVGVTIICLILPAILSFIITTFATAGKRLDEKPKSITYRDGHGQYDCVNTLLKTEKIYNPQSSGSGSGGGGGFSGGGGGHSGGGGGRF